MTADLTLYTDAGRAAALVTERTGLSPSDLPTLLAVTAGTLSAVTVYRPYYVAAKLIAAQRGKIREAEGVVFDDPESIIRELLGIQRALDLGLGLIVPPGMEATMAALLRDRQDAALSGRVDVIGTW